MIKDEITDTTIPLEMLREVLSSEGRLVIKPTGNSMGKLVAMAEAIVIEPMPPGKLFIGSIIVFPRQEGWIAHRVVSRSGKTPDWHYRTCGDAASRLDTDIVTHSTAIGIVREIRCEERIIDLRTAYSYVASYFRAVRNMIVTTVSNVHIT